MTRLLLWAQNEPLLLALSLIALILVLRRLIFNRLPRRRFLYYLFLFPGVVLHELSHWIACHLTGAKITKAVFFSRTGGLIEHSPPRLGMIGNFLISIAPLIGGLGIIALILRFSGISYFAQNSSVHAALSALGFYLGASVAAAILPSWQDFKNAFFSYLLLAIGLFILASQSQKTEQILFDFSILLAAAACLLAAAYLLSVALDAIQRGRHQ